MKFYISVYEGMPRATFRMFVVIFPMYPSAGERSARTKATSTRKDSGNSSKGEESEDTTKEKQSSKRTQGQQNSVQGTDFIKRNIEVNKL